MAITPGQQRTLAPKPVSSTSSIETVVSAFTDGGNEQNVPIIQPATSHQPMPSTVNGQDNAYTLQTSNPYPTQSRAVPLDSTLSTSFATRPGQVQISPSTGVVVPAMVPSSNTVPEFLYQLTKMLTDNNRDIIEWSNGKIEVHNPHKLQTHVLNRYFRHSKFASFQRQLNYFGFRKLAGKGKMAPCSYVNDATTKDLGSLLLIKRKAGNEPKSKTAKKREREGPESSSGTKSSERQKAAVNPVLANILYRSATDASDSSKTGAQYAAPTPPNSSQKAIARVAVGKGIRHSFNRSNTQPPAQPQAAPPSSTGSASGSTPVQASLSALKSNFHNTVGPGASQQTTTTRSNAYVPGSLRRDDSLVDLAMIPIVDDANETQNQSDTLAFIDFPWQDPEFPLPDP